MIKKLLWLLLVLPLLFTGCGDSPVSPTAIPTISSVSPASGYNDLYTSITITGTNFAAGATANVGAYSVYNVNVANSTTITGTVSTEVAAGIYVVTVTNTSGTSGNLSNGFTSQDPPGEWTKQFPVFNGNPKPVNATATLYVSESSSYYMYFSASSGIWVTSSIDGITWVTPQSTGITDTGTTDPVVLRLSDNSYMMIYGILSGSTERLYRATSTDGKNFTKYTGPLSSGAVFIADSSQEDYVSSPDTLYINSTTIRMYYAAGSTSSSLYSATSTDEGITWAKEGSITLSSGPIGGQTLSPDVVKLPDGTFRMLFATPPAGTASGSLRIRSATSTDGRSFTLESGSRVTPSGSIPTLCDPDSLLMIGSTTKYRIYYGGSYSDGTADYVRTVYEP